jgi:hypothetical protein
VKRHAQSADVHRKCNRNCPGFLCIGNDTSKTKGIAFSVEITNEELERLKLEKEAIQRDIEYLGDIRTLIFSCR